MRVSLLLVACASAQVHHKFHDGKRLVTAKYPTLAAATEWKAASETCPVRCQWDGRKVRTEHLLKHGKMIEWVPGASPDENINRIYHKCWHEAKTGVCTCECAHWDVDDCDVGSQVCATACGQSASIMKGTPVSVEDIGCFYGSDQLNDNQCLASDKPSTCTIECPATAACPTSSPTPAPTSVPTTAAPTKSPTPQGYIFDNGDSLRVAVRLWCNPATKQEARAKYGELSTWDTRHVYEFYNLFGGYNGPSFKNGRYWVNTPVSQCNPVGIGNWDTSKVRNFKYMFYSNFAFNQPIGNWDVSKGTDFSWMFTMRKWRLPSGELKDSSFNQDISKWDVGKAENMEYMFYDSKSFDQDLTSWDLTNVGKNKAMFRHCPISQSNKPRGTR